MRDARHLRQGSGTDACRRPKGVNLRCERSRNLLHPRVARLVGIDILLFLYGNLGLRSWHVFSTVGWQMSNPSSPLYEATLFREIFHKVS